MTMKNGRSTLGVSLILLLAAALVGATAAAAAPAAAADAAALSPAARAFEHLKSLAGDWQSRSTKGWSGTIRFDVIAGGTVVLATSEIDPHAGTTMATAFHLDGDRLMLTHYCVAGNQPRLEATEISDDGRSLLFTFRDGTNLASRDQGHMDSARLEIAGSDRYTSRWTWFQDGEERWLEEIENVRAP